MSPHWERMFVSVLCDLQCIGNKTDSAGGSRPREPSHGSQKAGEREHKEGVKIRVPCCGAQGQTLCIRGTDLWRGWFPHGPRVRRHPGTSSLVMQTTLARHTQATPPRASPGELHPWAHSVWWRTALLRLAGLGTPCHVT